MTLYEHHNVGTGSYHVYDSKGQGYALLPGKKVVLDVIRTCQDVVVREIPDTTMKQKVKTNDRITK